MGICLLNRSGHRAELSYVFDTNEFRLLFILQLSVEIVSSRYCVASVRNSKSAGPP